MACSTHPGAAALALLQQVGDFTISLSTRLSSSYPSQVLAWVWWWIRPMEPKWRSQAPEHTLKLQSMFCWSRCRPLPGSPFPTTACSCDAMVLSNEQTAAFSLPGWVPGSYPQFGRNIRVQEEFADDGDFPFEKSNFLF